MQINGKLTDKEIKAVAATFRSKWYWPRFLITNLYGFCLVGAALWAIFAGDKQHLNGRLELLVVLIAIFAWSFFSTQRQTKREFKAAKAGMPDVIEITPSGLHSRYLNGTVIYSPWTVFESWHQIETVYRLILAGEKSSTLLPFATLSQAEQEMLAGMLTSHLGPRR